MPHIECHSEGSTWKKPKGRSHRKRSSELCQETLVFNVYDTIRSAPDFYRQLRCGDSLVTLFHCSVQNKQEDVWSHCNYIVYAVDGSKVWHTAHGSYHLQTGDCLFVRKGACIVEHTSDEAPCFMFFFIPDEFIADVLKEKKSTTMSKSAKTVDLILPVENNAIVQAFFHSMMPYFGIQRTPDEALLSLKFRELILTLADSDGNDDLRGYFASLLQQPRTITLQEVMEANFCFNLKLDEFARLTARSLSAFKRDFENLYHTTPGKWLLEKRLNHSLHLLTNVKRTVREAAMECGFENPSHFSRAFKQHFGTPPTAVKVTSDQLSF
ncbi:MAG: AraC family transcriptional regulator [Chryseolinea sp.]